MVVAWTSKDHNELSGLKRILIQKYGKLVQSYISQENGLSWKYLMVDQALDTHKEALTMLNLMLSAW